MKQADWRLLETIHQKIPKHKVKRWTGLPCTLNNNQDRHIQWVSSFQNFISVCLMTYFSLTQSGTQDRQAAISIPRAMKIAHSSIHPSKLERLPDATCHTGYCGVIFVPRSGASRRKCGAQKNRFWKHINDSACKYNAKLAQAVVCKLT